MSEIAKIMAAPNSDLDRLLQEALIRPVVFEHDGVRYRLEVAKREDGWPDINPDRALRIMEGVIGSIPPEETEAVLAEIRRRRKQYS